MLYSFYEAFVVFVHSIRKVNELKLKGTHEFDQFFENLSHPNMTSSFPYSSHSPPAGQQFYSDSAEKYFINPKREINSLGSCDFFLKKCLKNAGTTLRFECGLQTSSMPV